MEREKVWSTNLASVGYDQDSALLEIEFKDGGVYQYKEVPEQIWYEFQMAQSKGSYFHAKVKSRFDADRIK